jgi:hypothetical protein
MQKPDPNPSPGKRPIAMIILAATFFLILLANYFKAPASAQFVLTLIGIVAAILLAVSKK